jgi:hypothetical protein
MEMEVMEKQGKAAYRRPQLKEKYDNFIGGKFVPTVSGKYFDNSSSIDGKNFTRVARSNKDDVELVLEAAHTAFETWGKLPPLSAAISCSGSPISLSKTPSTSP